MRVFLAFFAVVIVALAVACRMPQEGWTRQFGSTGYDVADRVAVDEQGAVYVTGWTAGALPGQRMIGGYSDIFVRKYAPSGRELWTRQLGSDGSERTSAMAIDSHGDVYVTGHTSGALDGQIARGEDDVFVLKLDPSGNPLWVHQFGSDAMDRSSGIALDDRDNVYVAGFTLGAVVGEARNTEGDIFVRKYDSAGRELWTRQFGSETYDEAFGVVVDRAGDIYLAGATRLALPGQPETQAIDAVLFKLDSEGRRLWTRQFGSSEADQARNVVVDSSGNVHVAGWTAGALPGKQSSGMTDAFLNTYDSDGVELATAQWGPVSFSSVSCIAIDDKGIPYLSTAQLDPMTEHAALGGDFKIGGAEGSLSAFSQASCVSLDRANNVYMVGWVLGALPDQTNAGDGDAFVVKSGP